MASDELKTTLEKKWITKSGLSAFVVFRKWSDEVSKIAPSLTHFRCGYVCVPLGHPLYKVEYSQKCRSLKKYNLKNPTPVWVLEVHGGTTFSNFANRIDGIDCQRDLWAFGFDCHHYDDSPDTQTLEYCISECEELARQLMEIKRDGLIARSIRWVRSLFKI